MDSLEIYQNSCRICLEHGALVDWNEELPDSCSTTYKYCYYKYTQLEENDTFSLLCESCSYDLRNFHFLIKKAIESYNILQETFAITFSQPCEIDEKFDIKEQISDDGDFETINFENSTELFEGDADNDNKDLLEFSMSVGETLEIPEDKKNERINKKPKAKKIKLTEKNVIGSKRHGDSKKPKDKETTLKNHNDFPEDIEVTIDIPEDVKETNDTIEENKAIAQSSSLNEKPLLDRTRKILCLYCPKFIMAEYMKHHEKTHKEHRERSERCEICGLRFFTKTTLYNHMDVHKDNREKRYKCEFCNKSYFTRGTCNIHRRIHLGQMKTCTICSKDFPRQCDLDRHTLNVHSTSTLSTIPTKKKYYVECKDCGKSIASIRWQHHQLLHSKKFQMKCTLCDKHFASKKSCHPHVRRFHKYTDDFAKVVEYYGDEIGKRSSLLMLKQTEVVKPILKNI